MPSDLFPFHSSPRSNLTGSPQFGLGYDACPGRNVANVELNKITATRTRGFDLRLVDSEGEWRFHELFVTSPSGRPVYVKGRDVFG